MTGDQQNLLSDGWLRREELLDLAGFIIAAHDRNHLGEGEYDHATSWPSLFEHARLGTVCCFQQRARERFHAADGRELPAGVWVSRIKAHEPANVHRFVFTDREGFVVDESEWCRTMGGARGYRNRQRAS